MVGSIMWGLWGQLHNIVETLDFLTNGRKLCDRRGRLWDHPMLQLAPKMMDLWCWWCLAGHISVNACRAVI